MMLIILMKKGGWEKIRTFIIQMSGKISTASGNDALVCVSHVCVHLYVCLAKTRSGNLLNVNSNTCICFYPSFGLDLWINAPLLDSFIICDHHFIWSLSTFHKFWSSCLNTIHNLCHFSIKHWGFWLLFFSSHHIFFCSFFESFAFHWTVSVVVVTVTYYKLVIKPIATNFHFFYFGFYILSFGSCYYS